MVDSDLANIKKTLYVLRRWVNRGRFTSVEHFADYLEGGQFVHHSDGLKKPYQLLKWMVKRGAHERYTSISAGLELACLLKSILNRPKLVHFLYGEYDMHYFPTWGRLLKLPVIASFHNPPAELKKRMVNSGFLKKLKGAILLGNNQKTYFEEMCPNVPTKFIPLGVDTDFFRPDSTKSHSATILIVGCHMRDWKVTKQFIYAIYKKNRGIKIQCLIPREYKNELPKESWVINTHPFTDEQLRGFYRSSTLMFYAPIDCVGSNAIVEALACGLPIVTLDVGGVRDYVASSNAFLHDRQDVDGMVESASILIQSEKCRSIMSASARERGMELDWKNIRKRYFDFYTELGVFLS